jgi:hypothetical protein
VTPAALNDGTDRPPRLRTDLHLGTVWDLPSWSAGPARGDDLYAAAAAAGFEGIQGGDPARCRDAGLACSTFGTVREPGGLGDLATLWQDLGFDCATLHIGTGHDTEAVARELVTEVLDVSDRLGFPLFVETHRATLTQDLWRTVQLVAEFDDLRFNGDFSHWYTGLEMTYGDFDAKVAFIAPVLERTRYLHGRIGDPGCIQIGLGPRPGAGDVEAAQGGGGADGGDDEPASVAHFRRLWTAAAAGFLRTAVAGDVLVFTRELLPPSIAYARTEAVAGGGRDEVSDRWTDALAMAAIARACFAEAASTATEEIR